MSPAADSFAPAPSLPSSFAITVDAATSVPPATQFVAVPVAADGPVAEELGFDRAALDAVGFTGDVGATHVLPAPGGTPRAAVGIGDIGDVTIAALRDAGGALGRASGKHESVAVVVPSVDGLPAGDVAQAIVEGVLLSRYTYDALRAEAKGKPITTLTLVAGEAESAEVEAGARTRSGVRRRHDARS